MKRRESRKKEHRRERREKRHLILSQFVLGPSNHGQTLPTMVRPFKSGSVHRLLSNVQMSSEQFMCGPHRFCINQVSLSTKVQRACACAWREQPLSRARQGSFSHHRRIIWNTEMTIGCCLKKTNETNFNNTSTDILLI